jgi:hypothetical protein
MRIHSTLALAIVGSMLALSPVAFASGGGDDPAGHNGGSGGGGGGNSGPGGSGGSGSGNTSNAVRNGVRAIGVVVKSAERAITQVKDARVLAIITMRNAGATAGELAAALADALAAIDTATTTGLNQVETARLAAQAALPTTATAGDRAAINAAAASGVARLNNRKRTANEDVTRAVNGPMGPGEVEHPIPEPGHPEIELPHPAGHR